MSGTKKRGETIRQFILQNIEKQPQTIVSLTAEEFSISRQAVHKHFKRLVDEELLIVKGNHRNRSYTLKAKTEWAQRFYFSTNITEDRVWNEHIVPLLCELPENVQDIWHYGFTEMFNNALEHSTGEYVDVMLDKYTNYTEILIHDNGMGIFKKIQQALDLYDERHAVLELAKGKFTTDPKNHTGEGIFFSSRMLDEFKIVSGKVFFSHQFPEIEDIILETEENILGTWVVMRLSNNSKQTSKEIFDSFTSDEDYAFNKTIVPVRMAQYGDDKLVSRSQAKRLLARVDKFKIVILDFSEVESIGQAFADEIFRVFVNAHPEIELHEINSNEATQKMIKRAKSAL